MTSCFHHLLVTLLLLAWAGSASAADHAGYAVDDPASWVEVYSLDQADLDPKGTGSNGALYVLSDKQERWDGQSSEFYFRLVTKVSEPDALSHVGSIQIAFDPAYQQLAIHDISLIRDGRVIDKLATARIDLLRREESLEKRLLDGHRTVAIEIEDLRVGDLVDYSYTVTGEHPVLRGHYFATFSLEYGVPVGVIRVRLTVPEEQYLNINYLNGRLEPSVSTAAEMLTYEWLERNSQGYDSFDDAPNWYLSGLAVQISSFRSWQDVIQFEMPFYSVPEIESPQLQAAIDQIRQEHPEPKARLRAILARIQSEIRYLGIELGEGGYVPRDPSLVFGQRFGDCKDMSLLMVTMARAMGISAFPAIVDSNKRVGRNGISPTPGYFDHVIVLARIGSESYWLDPTRTLQFGTIDHVFQPNFAEAMVLEPGNVDLIEMKTHDSTSPTIEIEEVFDLAKSFDGVPADYRVTSRYHSYRADSIRESIRRDGIDKVQERFLNYYRQTYPDLAMAEMFEVADDVDANIVTLREHYVIENAWQWDSGKNRFQFSSSPDEIESALDMPSMPQRSAPYARSHPVHVRQKTTVILPFSASIDEDEIEVEHAAFRFAKKTTVDDSQNATIMEYRYASKADAVLAEDFESFLAKLKQADDLTWFWARSPHLSESGDADLTDYGTLFAFWMLGYMILVPPAWFFYRHWRPVTIPHGTHYYPISRFKLFAMEILTFGVYPIYWAYRNWLSIKERDASKVAPKLFGLFYPITYFWLVRDVNRAAAAINQPPVRFPALWAVALLICGSLGFLDPPRFLADHLAAAASPTFALFLMVMTIACLIPCVDVIGRLNQQTPAGLNQNSRFGVESWLAVLIFLPASVFAVDLGYPTRDIGNVEPEVVEYLSELELVDPGEVIESFRAPSHFHFRHAGSVITDQKVLRYWTSDDLSYWYSEKAGYDDIVAITFESDPDSRETRAQFVRRQGDSVNLVLPEAEGEVVEVIKRLVERSPAAVVTYSGMDEIAGGDRAK